MSSQIGKWQRFENSVENDTEYDDPFRDVSLDVEYKGPDGTKISFWGFYDGDGIWRFRFMPDQVGIWSYTARFSDGSPGSEGQFTCAESDVPGMIGCDEANPLWFGFKGGKHLVVRSLHVGDSFLAGNMDSERRNRFLDWAEAQGYNMLSIASHYLNRQSPGRGAGWDTPRLWPLDVQEWRRMEVIVDDVTRRGILIFPFAGFFGRDSNFPTDPREQELYIRYVLARLAPNWNVLFNVSGPEPLLDKSPIAPMTREELDRLGLLIKRMDVFEHLIAVHNATGDDAFASSQWPTYTILQGPKTFDLDELSAGILSNHHAGRPLYAQETLWSGNKFHPDYSDTQLRKNAFVIIMGAGAINFIDNGGSQPGELGDSSSGFSGSLNLDDCRQARHDVMRNVWDAFESLPVHEMSPRQDLVDNGYCLAKPGDRYLVYLDAGGTVSIQAVLGEYSVLWINGQDTSDTRAGGRWQGGPLDAPVDGDDWLVYLQRA